MTGSGSSRPSGAWLSRLLARLVDCYVTADTRWLGLFRIAFGVLLCADLGRRWAEAREYYTNEGFLPNHYSLFRPMSDHLFSLFHALSSLAEVRVAFALTALVFVSYTVGYKTKLCQILAALLMTSLNARNLMVENGGDVVVDILTVVTAFLPLGRRFSIDALRASFAAEREATAQDLNRRTPHVDEPVVTLTVLFLVVQLFAIYFFNGVHKTGVGWRDGSAIHYFLHQDRIVTRFGVFLRDHLSAGMLRNMTYGALATEYVLPWLIVSPLFWVWTRRLALLLALGLHGIIALCSRLGPFSYVMVMFFLLLLRQDDFALLARWFGRDSRRRTVVYDEDCGVCLWLARLLKRLDVFERLTFVGNDAPELPAGVSAELTGRTLVVVDARGRVAIEEQAIRSVLFALPGGALLGVFLLVPGLRQLARAAYRAFASRRLEVSAAVGLGVCGVPVAATAAVNESSSVAADESATPRRRWRTLREELAQAGGMFREMGIALIAAVLLTQIAHDNPWLNRRMNVGRAAWMTQIVDRLRLIEGWGMFAPEPPYEDGRIVVDGRTKDGRKLDPFTGSAPDFDPYTPVGWGQEQFFCDYNNKIRFPWFTQHRQFLRDYLTHWHIYADRPQDELAAFDVWWIQDKSPKPGERKGQPLAPAKLIGYGVVRDSGAREWQLKLKKAPAARAPSPGAHP